MIQTNSGLPRVTHQAYPHWQVKSPPVPARSRLSRLEPIGIGTAKVESLSSYISRLAEVHCVSSGILLRREVFAPNQLKNLSSSHVGLGNVTTQINGTGNIFSVIVATLESLTTFCGLHSTTMQPWGHILSSYQLLRSKKVWCTACYGELLREGKSLYDPLLWALEAISICPWHHEQLCQICPHCNQQLPVLEALSKPGYCSKCRRYLGAPVTTTEYREKNKQLAPTAVLARQAAIFYGLAELLSRSQELTSKPKHQDFISTIKMYIDQEAHGSINLFADLVGIWSGTIRRMVKGTTKPSLEMLCQICSRLNISLFDLLHSTNNEYTPERINFSFSGKIPWSEVEGKLLAALRDPSRPSLEAVSKRIGYYPAKLKRHFPALCEQITCLYVNYIKRKHQGKWEIQRAFRKALKEQPPPSLQQVFRQLGCQNTGYYYYSHFPDLCFAVAQRFKAHWHKPFNRDVDRKRLHEILVEEPPPSFSEVARRFGHSREFLRQKFPELTKAIASRHMYYRTALRKEKAERLRQEIREAICNITSSRLYVSERRVKAFVKLHLPNLGRDILFKQALREVKAEMGVDR